MKYADMAAKFGVPYCAGSCGITKMSHETGFVFFDVIHFRERRFSRRGAKRFLMVVAWRARTLDPEWLNDPKFDWLYVYLDSVAAQKMAGQLGFRIPAHLFDYERMRCARLAQKRGVKLTKYPATYAWVYSWVDR